MVAVRLLLVATRCTLINQAAALVFGSKLFMSAFRLRIEATTCVTPVMTLSETAAAAGFLAAGGAFVLELTTGGNSTTCLGCVAMGPMGTMSAACGAVRGARAVGAVRVERVERPVRAVSFETACTTLASPRFGAGVEGGLILWRLRLLHARGKHLHLVVDIHFSVSRPPSLLL